MGAFLVLGILLASIFAAWSSVHRYAETNNYNFKNYVVKNNIQYERNLKKKSETEQ